MRQVAKIGVIGLHMFDCLLHSTLIFGWSSISVLLEKEGFYADKSDSLARILVISIGLYGIFLFLFGFIRDFVSYGFCRLLMYILLIVSYAMMLLAEPGKRDYLQYGWVLQFAAGIGIFLNGMQFFGLFPAYAGTLTGMSNSLLALCSLIPQLWLSAVVSWQVISYRGLILVWLIAAFVSLIMGMMFVPWHNMPQNIDSATPPETFWSLGQILLVRRNKSHLTRKSDVTFSEQIKSSLALLKSPIFIVHVIMFTSVNCTPTLSLNFVNRIMRDSVGEEQFPKLQSQFELVRAVGGFFICPTIGLLSDKSMGYWQRWFQHGTHFDVQKTLVPFGFILVSTIVFIVGLLMIDSIGVWLFLIGLTLCIGQIYMFETIGISVNFSVDSQGVIFALVEGLGALFAFIQMPIIAMVENTADHDEASRYMPFICFEFIMLALIILCLPILLMIGITVDLNKRFKLH